MSDQTTPLVHNAGWPGKPILLRGVGAAVRASLVVSPRPAALLVRRVFASAGAQFKAAPDKHAPSMSWRCRSTLRRRGRHVLDVIRPASASGPLPLVLWVHGGGWVGGSKDELTGYFDHRQQRLPGRRAPLRARSPSITTRHRHGR